MNTPNTDSEQSFDLLTRKQVADILNCKESTLERWTNRKVGPPSFKLGRLVRYDRRQLLAWISEQSTEVSQ
ncbi:MAG: DNA-binding protein [Candidatus Melainabacteria bacterium]|nr:MAG: DNA-binding protein [Candidatus Melainabacteria bacterium]